jgi:hypothetical protein
LIEIEKKIQNKKKVRANKILTKYSEREREIVKRNINRLTLDKTYNTMFVKHYIWVIRHSFRQNSFSGLKVYIKPDVILGKLLGK